jgi:hypothetical protein
MDSLLFIFHSEILQTVSVLQKVAAVSAKPSGEVLGVSPNFLSTLQNLY